MNHDEVMLLVGEWKEQGLEFELVGSLWRHENTGKKKEFVHDIDLLVKPENVESVLGTILAKKAASEPNKIDIELYIPDEGHYEGLLTALRAGKYRCIHERLMAGLKFSKKRI
jgi:hypothetical protein